MAGAVDRSHRPVVLYLVLLGTLVGVVALTASWVPRWGVDVLAGSRVVVVPVDADVSDADLRATAAELQRRARAAGASGAEARVRSDGLVQVSMPGAPDARVLDALRATGEVTVRLVLGGVAPPVVEESPADPGGAGDPDDPDDPDDADEPARPDDGVPDDGEGEVPEDGAGAGLPGGVANDPPVEPTVPACPQVAGMPVPEVDGELPELVCGPFGGAWVAGPALVTGADVTGARAVVQDGVWGVDLGLSGTAAARLAPVLADVGRRDDALLDAQATPAPGTDAADASADPGDETTDPEGLGPVRLVLELDDDVVLVAPLPADRDLSGDRLLLRGGLEQPDTEAVAGRVEDGALPTAVGRVDVIRLGSTLDADEGTRGAVAAVAAAFAALLGALLLLRRRAHPLLASTVGAAALVVPLGLLAEQVAGLPLGLPVAVAALVGGGVLPVLVWSASARVAGAPTREAVRRAGEAAWRRWWPPVAAAAVGAAAVRVVEGGQVGDVGTTLVVVLVSCLVAGRLLALPLAVLGAPGAATVEPAPSPAPRFGPRRVAAGALAAVLLAGVTGLLVRGVVGDPAFTAGEEHAVVVVDDPVDARGDLRDAAREAGVTVSSVRASGPDTVLLTTPRLEPAERERLVASLGAVAKVRGPVASVGFEAAGSGRSWLVGGLLLGVTALVGAALAGPPSRAVRRVVAALGVAAAAAVGGAGTAAWFDLTVSPAALTALASALVVGVAAAASLDQRSRPTAVARAAVVTVLGPLAAVVVVAPSVRAPFVLALAALVAALGAAVLHGRDTPGAAGARRTDPTGGAEGAARADTPDRASALT